MSSFKTCLNLQCRGSNFISSTQKERPKKNFQSIKFLYMHAGPQQLKGPEKSKWFRICNPL